MSDFFTQQAAARDSLSNFAASLNVGKDKAAHDHFFIYDLDRRQVEAMYRGDWLARKVIDIVPYDMVREWRSWAGTRADVQAIEREERRLNLRKAVQRALTLGRLYGGAAIIIGTSRDTPAEVASELEPDRIGIGDVIVLHTISRWQLNAPAINRDPLSPWFGEAVAYEIVAPTRGARQILPSRVLSGQRMARPQRRCLGLVRQRFADPLRRDSRGRADHDRRHQPHA